MKHPLSSPRSFCGLSVLLLAALGLSGCEDASTPKSEPAPAKTEPAPAKTEPAPAPAPGPMAGPPPMPAAPAPAPGPIVQPGDTLPISGDGDAPAESGTPCTVNDGSLDFTIPATFEQVWSVEAQMDTISSTGAATLEVGTGASSGTLTLSFTFADLNGYVTVWDSAGTATTLRPRSTTSAVQATINYVANSPISIAAIRGTRAPVPPNPPGTNAAVIKPVPTCPPT